MIGSVTDTNKKKKILEPLELFFFLRAFRQLAHFLLALEHNNDNNKLATQFAHLV